MSWFEASRRIACHGQVRRGAAGCRVRTLHPLELEAELGFVTRGRTLTEWIGADAGMGSKPK